VTDFETFMNRQMGRPPCPPWCVDCQMSWDPEWNRATPWVGLHYSDAQRVVDDQGREVSVRLAQEVFGVPGPVRVVVDGWTGREQDPAWLTADQVEQLITILCRYADRLRDIEKRTKS